MAEIYALSKEDVTVLKQVVQAWKSGNLGRPLATIRKSPLPSASIYAAISGSSGIEACSTAGVAGSASVTLVTVSTSGLIANSTVTLTAYNLAGSAVAGSKYLQLKRETLTGRWLVDFEDCG